MTYEEMMLEWADVLDSGKYKQYHGAWGGRTWIENEGYVGTKLTSFCCLSVALDHFEGKSPYDDEVSSTYICNMFGKSSGWTSQFIKWNDEEKLTFPEIAKRIRLMVATEFADG